MDTTEPTPSPRTPRDVLVLRILVGVVLAIVAILGLGAAYAYLITPAAIRSPHQQHVHLRLQVISGGQAVNFGDAKFQTAFNQDICTAALTTQPVHFHDGVDQFVHLHWADVTGGILLKDYGWNFIGGPDTTLGYRFDRFPRLVKVPVHGLELPKPTRSDNYYIYTGDQTSYHERNWHDFLTRNLTDFMAGQPNQAAQTQAGQINHVIGSVVIFAQHDKPTDQQVKDRFDHLMAIPTSQCSG